MGSAGEAWQSGKLSDEGVTITSIEKGVLRGMGWNMVTDKETPFVLDLAQRYRVFRFHPRCAEGCISRKPVIALGGVKCYPAPTIVRLAGNIFS